MKFRNSKWLSLVLALVGFHFGGGLIIFVNSFITTAPSKLGAIILAVMFPLNALWNLLPRTSGGYGVALLLSGLTYAFYFVIAYRVFRHYRPIPQIELNNCQICHYELTGNESGTCPECGTKINPPVEKIA